MTFAFRWPIIFSIVYNGYYFAPERLFLENSLVFSQKTVNGEVRLRCCKGAAYVLGRSSTTSKLYSQEEASMDSLENFDPEDTTGFIKIQAIRLKKYSEEWAVWGVKYFWPAVLYVRVQLSDIIGFKLVAYKTYRLCVLGVNCLVVSIPLVTSLFYLLRNSYREVLVICSVPELHHPYLKTRSGTRPQPFCYTSAGPTFMILNLYQLFYPQTFYFTFNILTIPGIAEVLLKLRSYTRHHRPLFLAFLLLWYKPIYLILRPCLVFECALIPWLISMMSFETSMESSWGSNNAKFSLKLLSYLLPGHDSISAFIK